MMPMTESDTASSEPMPTLTICFRRQNHLFEVDPRRTSLQDLREKVKELTGILPQHQKLLPSRIKGVSSELNSRPSSEASGSRQGGRTSPDQRTLEEVGLKQSCRIMVVGTPLAELEESKRVENQEGEERSRSINRKLHPSLLKSTKPRDTSSLSSSPSNIHSIHEEIDSPFQEILPHPTSKEDGQDPLRSKVIEYLRRLSKDPSILHLCKTHNLRCGILTELLPWENPNLLGLNENMGQRISLRVRTDDATGLRDYSTTRKVLVHELVHNTINDHPVEFNELNSKYLGEIRKFEEKYGREGFGKGGGGHLLDESLRDAYEPLQDVRVLHRGKDGTQQEGGQVVGCGFGNSGGGGRTSHPSGDGGGLGNGQDEEERRRTILSATMRRLEKKRE
ncbi:hypothetical protein IE53DRAFT_386607 [Violaceomyces palustris]|uniref:Uncharacterized protein n=1 Tax=Violaceomyces palustris TaxID=1673888 RepID=A0ACD0NYY6_9BASI|nr:hypothetical protein IE53DRAFT_386607 [Violaceomyces palustris]